ncbi:MAG: tetratricopeptide repeat protein [Candidatus Sericytochromatia bacterium]|nr:tetratricopeptide repeat protein [Candidatus Sericytochromatia bacterium]
MSNFNILLNSAKKEHEKGNFLGAKILYIRLLEFEPNNPDINHFLGVIYSHLNDKQNAYFYLKKSIEIAPNNIYFYTNLAKLLMLDDKTKQAIQLLIEAIEKNPDSAETCFNLANIFKMNNNYHKAIDYYKKAIQINPNYADAYNNMGLCQAEYWRSKDAFESFKKVLELNPNYPNAKRMYHVLEDKLVDEERIINKYKTSNIFSKFEYNFDENEIIADYLTLLKKCLSDTLRIDEESVEFEKVNEGGIIISFLAETMIGIKRLNNLHYCIVETIKNNIAGDLIETGVWKGGATILMRAVLKAYNIKDKLVWLADSFEGLPMPNTELYPADTNSIWHNMKIFNVSIDDVKNNFRNYGLLDDQVKFLKGWFKDTLPTAPIEKISVLRLDGDMYESTMDAMKNLYPKLSIGGYVIIDDWGIIPNCNQAITDYRKLHNIQEKIEFIDFSGIYWKKEVDI